MSVHVKSLNSSQYIATLSIFDANYGTADFTDYEVTLEEGKSHRITLKRNEYAMVVVRSLFDNEQ